MRTKLSLKEHATVKKYLTEIGAKNERLTDKLLLIGLTNEAISNKMEQFVKQIDALLVQ